MIRRQRAFLADKDIRGRIYIAPHGINCQAGGTAADARAYVDWIAAQPEFEVRCRMRMRMRICACARACQAMCARKSPTGGGRAGRAAAGCPGVAPVACSQPDPAARLLLHPRLPKAPRSAPLPNPLVPRAWCTPCGLPPATCTPSCD